MSDRPSLDAPDRRRAFVRTVVHIPVTVISSQRRKTDIVNGKASDLSEGGMGVVVASDLETHQPIWIQFKAPRFNQQVQMRAVVRHSSEGRYGLQFQHPTRDQLEQIQRIISVA